MEWIQSHSSLLQVALNAAMVLIWLVYLQIFLVGYLRQRRPEILINLGPGVGLKARCFISNLGLEPIYVLDVIVTVWDGEKRTAIITDRTELSDEELGNPAEATNQGPLASGAMADIGSFEMLIERARKTGLPVDPEAELHRIEVTVAAASSAKGSFVGASRRWAVERNEDRLHLRPTKVGTRQIRSLLGRRRLRAILSRRLAAAQ